jgi:hypothetical protein
MKVRTRRASSGRLISGCNRHYWRVLYALMYIYTQHLLAGWLAYYKHSHPYATDDQCMQSSSRSGAPSELCTPAPSERNSPIYIWRARAAAPCLFLVWLDLPFWLDFDAVRDSSFSVRHFWSTAWSNAMMVTSNINAMHIKCVRAYFKILNLCFWKDLFHKGVLKKICDLCR